MSENLSVEQAGWLIGKIVAISTAVGAATIGMIRLVNRPMQNDINAIKDRLASGDIAIKSNQKDIAEIKSDVRNMNTRLDYHFSDEAEQHRAERISRVWLEQLRNSGWTPDKQR